MKDQGWIGYCGLIRDQSLGLKLWSNDLSIRFDYRMGVNFGVIDSHKGIEYHRLEISLPLRYRRWTFTPALIGQIRGGDHQTYVKKDEVFGTLSARYKF